jgi:Leucine-rich repeat (LRR) protein
LDLSSNVVSSLPRDMSALANLTVLNLDDNPIR